MKSTAVQHKPGGKIAPSTSAPSPGYQDRLNHIATAAYYMAEARGFTPGQELDDWLDAEAKFNACEER